MTGHLDPRQRAMLQEMGIALPVLPRSAAPGAARAPAAPPAPAASAAPAAEAAAPTLPAPDRAPLPTPAPRAAPAEEQSAAPSAQPMDLVTPVLLGPSVAPYASEDAAGGTQGGWLVLLECTDPTNPLAGDAGALLDNMLRAMGLHREAATQVVALLQPAPLQGAAPAMVGTPLDDLLGTLRPRRVLLLGLGAARAVLGSREPLARLRARAHRLADGTPAAVSHDPSYLLHAPQAKAAAWLDLCRALALDAAGTGAGG